VEAMQAKEVMAKKKDALAEARSAIVTIGIVHK